TRAGSRCSTATATSASSRPTRCTRQCGTRWIASGPMPELQNRIEELWERRDLLTTSDADAFAVVRNAVDLLDRGEARVGVLEPPQAAPVMVGDRCLIGSRCMVVNGARVGDESVLGAGTILTGNLPVIDAETGEEVSRGIVPPRCVVVYATRPKKFGGGEFGLPCALIIRRLESGERQHLNEVLRESEVAVD